MTTNRELNNIIETLSKINYNSYSHIQSNAKIKLIFNSKRQINSPLFKDLIVYIKKKLSFNVKKHSSKDTLHEARSEIPHKIQKQILHKIQKQIPHKIQKQIPHKIHQKIDIQIPSQNTVHAFEPFLIDNISQISISKRNSDFYSQAFFRAINNELDIYTDKEMINYIKEIKYKVIEDFYARNIYKRKDYSSKHFKKNELDDVFANNLSISLHMLRVYGDVFNLNIVYIDSEGSFIFLTFYDKEKATVIITEDNYSVYTLRPKGGTFIRGKQFYKYLYNKMSYNKDKLDTLSISNLQNICKLMTIDYKKKGKTKRINKTKKELTYELINSK